MYRIQDPEVIISVKTLKGSVNAVMFIFEEIIQTSVWFIVTVTAKD